MPLSLKSTVIDAKSPADLARFWSEALNYELHIDDDSWAWLTDSTGTQRLSFQFEREPKSASNRLHLDIQADDVDTEVERLSKLGATVKKKYPDPQEYLVVMQDPEGNEFCVFS